MLLHDHSEEAIAHRLREGPNLSYVRDWVYGGIDGAVTTFAIVAGVVGANLSARIILILGLANLVADGFSMAASNYAGTKHEKDDQERTRIWEERQIDREPEGEAEEMRQIYRSKGFEGEDLDRAVEVITSNRDEWVKTMMIEEYGMPHIVREPIKSGLATFVAFGLCGAVPLAPYFVFAPERAFTISLGLTAIVFLVIGSAKSRWSLAPWWKSGAETLVIGLGAAAIAYLIGFGLKTLV